MDQQITFILAAGSHTATGVRVHVPMASFRMCYWINCENGVRVHVLMVSVALLLLDRVSDSGVATNSMHTNVLMQHLRIHSKWQLATAAPGFRLVQRRCNASLRPFAFA